MSESSSPRKRLPIRPSEEHLKKQAKRKVKLDPKLQLAEAQHQLAQEYGCASWAELMRAVKMIQADADLDAVDRRGNTPLWMLCKSSAPASNRLAVAKLLLEKGASIRRACENQSTALHQAAGHGPVEMVELLLRHGAKEWQTDRDGKKALDYAKAGVASDKEAIIELLDRPVIRDAIFKSAMHAVQAGDIETLQSILRDHPNLVHTAAIEPDCYPQAYFSNPKLLWFVANNPTLMEKMPANIAAIAESIINAGASAGDLDYTLELVMTSSPAREQNLQLPLMKVLLSHGAKPGDLLSVLAHRELEPVRFLIQQGMPMTAPVAAALGMADALPALLASSDAKTRQTAFGIAVINQQLPAARICVNAGVDVNAFLPVHAHSLPVHQAAVNDDVPMLQLLIEHGGRLDIRDTLWNATPLNWAIHTGKPAAEKYLRSINAP